LTVLGELDPATPVALSDVFQPIRLTREHWALACRINGPTCARDLARACGIALPDAIERLSALIDAGLCVQSAAVPVPRPRPPAPAPRPQPAGPVTAPVDLPAPREPGMDILRQVLNGLKKLS
jgi:hypothetical protein